jgi:hypothetical protein
LFVSHTRRFNIQRKHKFLSQLSDKFSWTEDKVPHGQDFYQAYMSCCDSIEQSEEKGTMHDHDGVDTTRMGCQIL